MSYPNAPGGGDVPGGGLSRGDITELRDRVDRQNLLLQTLLRLLLEKGVIQEQEFKQWLVYVDEYDGVRDGKLGKDSGIMRCSSCGRVNPTKSIRCMYCSADFDREFLAKDRSGM